ncbi:hypothetical protein JW992_02460 [candidate division KSB1 bacterium]|nr:hypothetical protein [candidate division KSB1 bacterium]
MNRLDRNSWVPRLFPFIFFFVASVAAETGVLPTPAKFPGFHPGVNERSPAGHQEIVDYFYRLAAASPRIAVQELGQTREGRPLILAICTAPQNFVDLQRIRQERSKLVDPRATDSDEAERAFESGKAIVSVNCSIHAREIGPAQMSASLAYFLAADTSETSERILRETIILLIPVHNPDGLDRVIEWYRRHRGSDYVGGYLPFLGHPQVGHDINRDWFMLTQPETRLTVEQVYTVWYPHVVMDLHQMGARGTRLFLPPYIDPHDEELDPLMQAQINALGTAVAAQLTAEGKRGVAVHACFDAYSPSRAFCNYHNGVRFLTEIASARLADPLHLSNDDFVSFCGMDPRKRSWNLPLPWSGGTWGLTEIIDYGRSTVLALLDQVARNRRQWLETSFRVARTACAQDRGYPVFFIPPDPWHADAARVLLTILEDGKVEFYRAQKEFAALDTVFPAGTIVIPTAQPFGAYARTLLRNQPYPGVDESGAVAAYDVTSHCLPLYFGVHCMSGREQPDVPLVRVSADKAFLRPPFPDCDISGFLVDIRQPYGGRIIGDLWASGFNVYALSDSLGLDDRILPPGTLWCSDECRPIIERAYKEYSPAVFTAPSRPQVAMVELEPVRIGLYEGYAPQSDAGWTRFFFEQQRLPLMSVSDSLLRQGVPPVDVLIFSDQSPEWILYGQDSSLVPPGRGGGIGLAGVRNLLDFMQTGGRLVFLNRASRFPDSPQVRDQWGETGTLFIPVAAPGSLLRGQTLGEHPLCWGMPKQVALFNRQGFAFKSLVGEKIIGYPDSELLLGGVLKRDDALQGSAACLLLPYGKGEAILFGFQPQFRCQTLGTFRLMLNAAVMARAVAIETPVTN